MSAPKKDPNADRFLTEEGDLRRVDAPKAGEKEKSVLDLLREQGFDPDSLTNDLTIKKDE